MGTDMALMLRLCGIKSLYTYLAINLTKEVSKNREKITQFKSEMFSIDFHTNSIHAMSLLLKTTDKFRDYLKGCKHGFRVAFVWKSKVFVHIWL